MFTGIVEEVGTIRSAARHGNGVLLDIACTKVTADLTVGASVAVQGVCQTVLEHDAGGFRIAAESETLRVTNFATLAAGARVNLERALRVGGRLDGHWVLGHVDGCARVTVVRTDERTRVLEIELPATLRTYVVPKGCIALDGVSLTVGPEVRAGRLEVFLIPYTWEHTTLGARRPGDSVNVEVDVVGRYVVHLLQGGQATAADVGLARASLGTSASSSEETS